MKTVDLEALTIDELWALHEEAGKVLTSRLSEEKLALEKRLALLQRGLNSISGDEAFGNGENRRKYPKVHPKYRNPSTPSQTWSGRGKQPRWIVAALKSGRKIDDFIIAPAERF